MPNFNIQPSKDMGTNWNTRGQTGTQEALSKYCEAQLYSAGDGALAQAAQRGCNVSSLKIFKNHLDMCLGTLLWVLEQGLDQMPPFPPQPFYGSVKI